MHFWPAVSGFEPPVLQPRNSLATSASSCQCPSWDGHYSIPSKTARVHMTPRGDKLGQRTADQFSDCELAPQQRAFWNRLLQVSRFPRGSSPACHQTSDALKTVSRSDLGFRCGVYACSALTIAMIARRVTGGWLVAEDADVSSTSDTPRGMSSPGCQKLLASEVEKKQKRDSQPGQGIQVPGHRAGAEERLERLDIQQ